jgi:glycosyltransferase involved in cell wall biosynthesis
MKIATILDEFSELCFAYEASIVPLRQENFAQQIIKNPDISFLFVESAWRGSNKSWKLSSNVCHSKTNMFHNFEKVIALCRQRKIPCVFWNKEDPVHYKHFIHIAKYFDYIFTTDVGSKKNYVRDLRQNKVYTLPFAAQPKIHYPNALENRTLRPCFAGTYWRTLHKKRVQDMNHILSPAIKHGLHIYDRNRVVGSGEKWPNCYIPCIKGGLPYNQLVSMYRDYRVFLNVNCIVDSLTMFSRRVFELLACGTPVISSYALGIETLLPEVYISKTTRETTRMLTNLLKNDQIWNTASVAGIRAVYEQHTYAHRLAYICETLGLPVPAQTKNRIANYKRISEMEPFDYKIARDLIAKD